MGTAGETGSPAARPSPPAPGPGSRASVTGVRRCAAPRRAAPRC